MKNDHIPALDGVRGLAIALVMAFHFWQAGVGPYAAMSGSVKRILSLATIGQKGVDLFFVLSGFLITGILLLTKSRPRYFMNFYARRSLRIFPLYYLVVGLCIVSGALFGIPSMAWKHMWPCLLYLQNFYDTFSHYGAGPFHFWSLAVEEHFYLLWPLTVFILSRRNLAILCIGLIAGSLLIRLMFLSHAIDVFTFTLCRMDALALGGLLAILNLNSSLWQIAIRIARWSAVPLAIIALTIFAAAEGQGFYWLQAAKYTLFAFLCGVMIVLALSPGRFNPLPAICTCSWLRSLGKTSYAIYMFHPFVFSWLVGRLYLSSWSPLRGMLWPSYAVEFIVCVFSVWWLSIISWRIFERPFQKLKDRFSYALPQISVREGLPGALPSPSPEPVDTAS
jgi:peptidoglycan/LPS O-acetylase OafA/YrhL